MLDKSFTFAGAGEQEAEIGRATHWRIIEASADVYVSVDNGPFVKRSQGSAASYRVPFGTIRVKSLVAQTVVITTGDADTDEPENVNVSVAATVAPGNTLGAGGDVTLNAALATAIIGSDATRLSVTIRNPITNTASVRIGGAGVGATSGLEIEPGETITLATTAAVYGYSVPGETVQAVPVREV